MSSWPSNAPVGSMNLEADFNALSARARSVIQGVASKPYFDIRDYGAKVDGVTDDSPAVTAALQAAIAIRGGVIFFPRGSTRLTSGSNVDALAQNNGEYIIQGEAGSRILPRALGNNYGISISNANSVTFRDLIVLGASSGGSSSAGFESLVAIFAGFTVRNLKFQNLVFGGVATQNAGNIFAQQSVPDVENCIFGGCTGTNQGVMDFYQVPAFSVRQTQFIDYLNFDGTTLSKYASTGNTKCWIQNRAPVAVDGPTTGLAYRLNQVWMDENSSDSLMLLTGTADHTLDISDSMFASGLGGTILGGKFTTFRKAMLENVMYGIAVDPGDHEAARFTDVAAIEFRNVHSKYGAKFFTIAGTSKRFKGINFGPQGNATYPLGLNNTANALIDSDFGMPSTASAAALAPKGRVTHVTGTTNITSITATNFKPGDELTLIFDGVLTVTDGGNLKLAGNFVTSADDCLVLVYDGTNFIEKSRSAN